MKITLHYIVINFLCTCAIAYDQAYTNPLLYKNFNNGYYGNTYIKLNDLSPRYPSTPYSFRVAPPKTPWMSPASAPSWVQVYNRLAAAKRNQQIKVSANLKTPKKRPNGKEVASSAQRKYKIQIANAARKMQLENLRKAALIRKAKSDQINNFYKNIASRSEFNKKISSLPLRRNLDYKIKPPAKLRPKLSSPLSNQYFPSNYQLLYQNPLASNPPFQPGSITPVLFYGANKTPFYVKGSTKSKIVNSNAGRRANINTVNKTANIKMNNEAYKNVKQSSRQKQATQSTLENLSRPKPTFVIKSIPHEKIFIKTNASFPITRNNISLRTKYTGNGTNTKQKEYSLKPMNSVIKFHIENRTLSYSKKRPVRKNFKKSLIATKNKKKLSNSSTIVFTSIMDEVNKTTGRKQVPSLNEDVKPVNKTFNDKLQNTTIIYSISKPHNTNQSKKLNQHGWKRHHVFRPVTVTETSNYKNNNEWAYKKYRVYHSVNPVESIESKREHLEMPVEFDSDEDILNDENYYPDGAQSFDEADFEGDDEDDDSDEDLPDIKPKIKIPIVNIETPSISGLPEKIKHQLEATVQPVYKIIKGNVKSASEFKEQLDNDFEPHKITKDVPSVRKSMLEGDSLFNDYVPNDNEAAPPRMPTDKSKMNEEELEALKEDQVATSLMKQLDTDKPKMEDQEVLGFDKQSTTASDKVDNNQEAVTDGMLPGQTFDSMDRNNDHENMFNHPLKPSKFRPDADSSNADKEEEFRRLKPKKHDTYAGRKNVHLVDKNKISDGELDFPHPVNEIDAFDNLANEKSNDYEQYSNEEQDNASPSQHDDVDLNENSNDHRMTNMERSDDRTNNINRNDVDGLKPIEYTMKQGEESVDDALNKLQNNDNFDPDKINPMDETKHFHHDISSEDDQISSRERNLFHNENQASKDEATYLEHEEPQHHHKRFRHAKKVDQPSSIDQVSHSEEQSSVSDDNVDDMGNALKAGVSLEDMLDPEKAQERANHLSEQVEIAKKIDREVPPVKNIDLAPPINDVNSNPLHNAPLNNINFNSHFSKPFLSNDILKMPRNTRGVLKQEPRLQITPKSYNEILADQMKVDDLSPEDALHALNGKKSLKELLERNNDDEDHYGPPDAVINTQFGAHSKDKNLSTVATSLETTTKINPTNNTISTLATSLKDTSNTVNTSTVPAKSDSKLHKYINETVASKKDSQSQDDIQISELQNTTVTKEVVNILESIGQLRPASNSTKPISYDVSDNNNKNNNIVNKTEEIKTPILSENTTKLLANELHNNTFDNKTANEQKRNETDSSTDDLEETETKEAVHDLNIAISILEKKLSLISAAKKSGNKKAIYIVDETLRNSKPVTKSIIATHRNGSNHCHLLSNFTSKHHVRKHSKHLINSKMVHSNTYNRHLKKHKKYRKTRIKRLHKQTSNKGVL